MEKYNYNEAVKNDVAEYYEENEENYTGLDKDQLQEALYDDCFVSDSVTGNASGSYYCNAWKAEEALLHNQELLVEAIEEFGDDSESYKKAILSPEWADVTIRCYVLDQAVSEFLDELEED